MTIYALWVGEDGGDGGGHRPVLSDVTQGCPVSDPAQGVLRQPGMRTPFDRMMVLVQIDFDFYVFHGMI